MVGYALERHLLSKDCMLFKNLNSWDVKELHTIFLLELEGNHSCKQLGRDVMQAALKH